MLARGQTLAGQPLQPPRFHHVAWKVGSRFGPEQDPDRIMEPWEAPEFVALDPAARHSRLEVEEIHLPHKPSARSFARVVRNVLTEQECAALIDSVNRKGFTPALVNMGGGLQELRPDYRDGFRVMVDSPALTSWLLEVLRPHLPESVHDGGRARVLESLNERCRFLCYTPGQEFGEHHDARFNHPVTGASSFVTVQIYLHDVAPQSGGATTFLFRGRAPDVPCQPGAGTALIFSQDLLHEGSLLNSGLKYTVRTEAMYTRKH